MDGEINYFDLATGFSLHNNENLFFGLYANHMKTPDTSFNSTAKNKNELLLSLQAGYEYDLISYNQVILPRFSYLFLYNSIFTHFEELILGIKTFIPTKKKIQYLQSLLRVGFDTIDFGSFI